MRDVILTLVIVGLMPVCFRRPFIGLVVFSWLAYMRVQDLTWGFARYQRWSYYIAIVTFAGFLASRRQRLFVHDVRSYLMLALVALVGIGMMIKGHASEFEFVRYTEFVKIVGVALFTTAVVRTREHLRILVWVIALSLGFYGVKSGIWGVMSMGRSQILQGPGGMLADNNDFSLALAMAVPMLFYIGMSEKREILRRAFLICVPFTIMTIVLTHSRGGFLSISAALAVMIWRSRNRLAGFSTAAVLAIAGLVLMPPAFKERLATLANPTEEGSAMGRIRAWGIAARMVTDNPVWGVGFGNFRARYLDYCLDPTPQELAGTAVIVAHNSYFQIWAEAGTPTLLLYLSLIAISFGTCWRIRRMAKRRYHESWILNYAAMFEASLAAFVVGATFLNRAHFDLFYHWVAIILLFGIIARREMAEDRAPGPAGRGARGRIHAVPASGFGGPLPVPRGFRGGTVRPREA